MNDKPKWDGEGLPPVGTMCEYFFQPSPILGDEIGQIIFRDREWVKAEVIHHHIDKDKTYAIVHAHGFGYRGCSDTTGEMFRNLVKENI